MSRIRIERGENNVSIVIGPHLDVGALLFLCLIVVMAVATISIRSTTGAPDILWAGAFLGLFTYTAVRTFGVTSLSVDGTSIRLDQRVSVIRRRRCFRVAEVAELGVECRSRARRGGRSVSRRLIVSLHDGRSIRGIGQLSSSDARDLERALSEVRTRFLGAIK